MTSDETGPAARACEQAFGFLVDEFGYQPRTPRFGSGGFSLRYAGSVLGIVVDWYPRDPLTVWLVRLVDGEFPPRAITVYPDTPLHYFDLEDVELISDHHRIVRDLQLYALPDEENSRLLAGNLRRYGADLLRGDLTRLPQLEERIRDRARAAATARLGAERAGQLGW